MNEHFYAVIMAGGGGTRLWPLSLKSRPKQMLQLGSERTLFQMAVDRLASVFSAERILVVTVAEQASQLQAQCPQIPPDNFLLEPLPRGTASVVGLAALALQQRDPQATMAVLTADHYILNVEHFCKLLRYAEQVAQSGFLVTLGIEPTYPATGYGYIQRGEPISSMDGNATYRVARFKEKPDEATAARMLEQGDHYWNSGMFIWRVDRILDEFSTLMPELAGQLATIASAWNSDRRREVLAKVWHEIKPQTIDYGIMEKAEKVAVLPGSGLGWNDVGSWESLFDVLPADENGNIILKGTHFGLDTHSSLVYSNSQERLIVTIGISDMIVVDTGKSLLICPRNNAQKVRELVNALKQNGYQEYL